MFDIQEELKKLPGKPGVYLMHDETDKILSLIHIYLAMQKQKIWIVRLY